ncbi:MAG TPA: aquaporin [Candidatus Nanopelagicales bacterium]
MSRKLIAEFVGTFLLVFLAVGAAVFGIGGGVGADSAGPASGTVGVALAFGLVVLMLAYAFGPVSGTHVNPAVTLGVLLAKRMPAKEAVGYWAAQFAGAILGGAVLKLFVSSFGVTDRTGGLGTNSYDNGAINLTGAFVLEAFLTAAFVLVILLATERIAAPGFAGVAIGLALTAVHLVGIPLTGTSVNPARSFGPALFEGGTALSQVWLFILAPLAGAVIGWAIWRLTRVEGIAEPEGDVLEIDLPRIEADREVRDGGLTH